MAHKISKSACNTILTYIFTEVVSRPLLQRSYSNSNQGCYEPVTALGAVQIGTGIKKMKKILLVTASLIALGAAAPAVAADLAARPYTKAPAMIAAVYDWSGFYVGANGGWGSSHKCWDFLPAAGGTSPEGCHDATGGVAGGQVGYRWQTGTWVFGLEAQGDWAGLKGSNVSIFNPLFRNESRVDAFGLFTGQVGYGRIRSPVHAGPHLHLQLAGRRVRRYRSHPSGRRSRHRPRELQVRRPRGRQVLRQVISRTLRDHRSPGHRPGLFCWVRASGRPESLCFI